MVSCNPSLICRIDWRPSRALAGALMLLGVLAASALGLSALPRAAALLSSAGCVLIGATSARRHLRLPEVHIVWPGRGEPALITSAGDTQQLASVSLHLRGPIAVLTGRDAGGRKRRWVWFPDTLPSADRRALRLVASLHS